jgi:hypothetical protein
MIPSMRSAARLVRSSSSSFAQRVAPVRALATATAPRASAQPEHKSFCMQCERKCPGEREALLVCVSRKAC